MGRELEEAVDQSLKLGCFDVGAVRLLIDARVAVREGRGTRGNRCTQWL